MDRSVVQTDNQFNRDNPFYKQSAGAFYDYKYVSPSAEALIRMAQIRPEQMPGTLDALRAYVYDYLDAFVRGNGSITPTQVGSCVARMDGRFDLLLDSLRQRELYRLWRDGDSNKLRFLMTTAPRILTDPYWATHPRIARPAECEGFSITAETQPAEQVPYPRIGQPWPFDFSTAMIVKDPQVAHPDPHVAHPPVSVEVVRALLKRYVVISQMEWKNSYSHVAGMDEGGWLVAGKQCFAWTIRPGGLAWITAPNGKAVYLTEPCQGSDPACAGR